MIKFVKIMENKEQGHFYLPALDGLRFVAFFLVFIHNALPILSNTFLNKISEFGWIGVDLFFCLSAFLITKLLITEYQAIGSINIQHFYFRRILRIGPLYIFYIFVSILFIFNIPGRNINIPGHLLGLLTFTFNFSYFALLPSPILLFIHLWTISYEMQFYLVAPWLVKITHNKVLENKKAILLTIFLTGNLIRALFILLQVDHPAIYFLPFTHFEALLGGVAIALGAFDRILSKINHAVLLLLGFLSVMSVSLLPNFDTLSWGLVLTYPLVGIGMSTFVLLLVNEEVQLITAFLKNKTIVYLGKISYGLYVFHFSSFVITSSFCSNILGIPSQQFPDYFVLILTISFLITVFFSSISYYLIEKPFLVLKNHFTSIPSRPL